MMHNEETLGKYRILDELGRGGFATVYRALDTTLDREVALKVLDPLLMRDRAWVQRFQREARAVANLRHPHIVTIYEVAEADGRIHIAMELARGGSLADALAQRGRLPWDEMLALLRPICEALDYAHQQGVIHRDLKPANILLDPESGPLLSDFGFARLVAGSSASVSLSGGILGTPAYMAPEIWDEDLAEAPADFYALGCIVYEILTAQVLFKSKTPMQAVRAHALGPQYPNAWPSDVPVGIEAVLSRVLAPRAEQRYMSASAFWSALRGMESAEQAGNRSQSGHRLPDSVTAGSRADSSKGLARTPGAVKSAEPKSWPVAAKSASHPPPDHPTIASVNVSPSQREAAVRGARQASFHGAVIVMVIIASALAIALAVKYRPQQPFGARESAGYSAIPTPLRAPMTSPITTPTIGPSEELRAAESSGRQVWGFENGILWRTDDMAVSSDFAAFSGVLADFVVEVVFENPEISSGGGWDYGLSFRNSHDQNEPSTEMEYHLVWITQSGHWYHAHYHNGDYYQLREAVKSPYVKTQVGEANSLKLIAVQETGELWINDHFVGRLELSRGSEWGRIFPIVAASHTFTETVAVREFVIWTLDP